MTPASCWSTYSSARSTTIARAALPRFVARRRTATIPRAPSPALRRGPWLLRASVPRAAREPCRASHVAPRSPSPDACGEGRRDISRSRTRRQRNDDRHASDQLFLVALDLRQQLLKPLMRPRRVELRAQRDDDVVRVLAVRQLACRWSSARIAASACVASRRGARALSSSAATFQTFFPHRCAGRQSLDGGCPGSWSTAAG